MKEKIEQIMTERGVTKRELARRLGILPQNVNVFITTDNLSKLQKVADVIGCDVADFISKPLQEEINGYIEFNGVVYRIKTLDDFNSVATIITQNVSK